MQILEQVDGRWCAKVDLQDGSPIQAFYGETKEEVIGELIKAQTHATKAIREHKKALKIAAPQTDPARNVPDFKPRSLSADERYRLSQQINDPSQSPDAVRSMIEAEIGAPIATIRETLNMAQEQAERNRCMAEAQRFLREHPDFIECPENESSLVQYLQNRNLDYTARNLAVAYEDLKSDDLLQLKVQVAQPVAPVGRPRSASTGIPARSNTRVSSAPVGPTVEELERMSHEEYRNRMGDPQFRAAVDKLYAPKTPRP